MNDPADPTVPTLSRRQAIQRMAALLGGAACVSATALLAAHENAGRTIKSGIGEFTPKDIAFLDEVAETILPQTSTPGAKAAHTGAFMALMVTDSYRPAEQRVFHDGMRKVEDAARKAHGISFMMATPEQRTALLTAFDLDQKRVMDAREAADVRTKALAPLPPDETAAKAAVDLPGTAVQEAGANVEIPAHFFRMMKQLALLGYYTSEVGCTQALRYIETPGRFDPCIPYTAGEPAWAAHA